MCIRDSVVNGFNQGWIYNWVKNNWKTSGKEPVKNKEIWQALYEITKIHKVKFVKVKGHSDNALSYTHLLVTASGVGVLLLLVFWVLVYILMLKYIEKVDKINQALKEMCIRDRNRRYYSNNKIWLYKFDQI